MWQGSTSLLPGESAVPGDLQGTLMMAANLTVSSHCPPLLVTIETCIFEYAIRGISLLLKFSTKRLGQEIYARIS